MPDIDPRTAALDRLGDAHQARLAAEAAHRRAELAAVAAARQAGATWQQIGQAVGMQRPHAQRKYAPLLDEQRSIRIRDQ